MSRYCVDNSLIYATTSFSSVPRHSLTSSHSTIFCTLLTETGLAVNADKTKYMVMSREQAAGLSHTMKVDNSSIEGVEEFKYLGTTINQNSIRKEIKSRLKLGNACYHSVQNLLSYSLL